MAKVAKNGRKVKAIALLFCCFLPTYEKWEKSLKMAKVAKNGRKVKAIALLFCCFLPTYEKWQKSLKMDES
jgi:hypothetical protein